jgi:phosphate/sulfate permease
LGATLNGASITDGPVFKLTNDLVFELNVTDAEDGKAVEYAELMLINQETKENISFYTPPNPELNNRTIIEISASLLYSGTWNVYVIAYDIDGTSNYDPTGGDDNENLVGVFEIEPDLSDVTSIVILVIIAGIVGFVVGGFLLWRYARSKIKDIKSDFLIKSKSKGKISKGKTSSTYVEPPAEAEGKKPIKKESNKQASSSKKSRKTKKRF